MRFNSQQRKVIKFLLCSSVLLLIVLTGLVCWIKANEERLLLQIRQQSGCSCRKKFNINQQILIPQFKETCK